LNNVSFLINFLSFLFQSCRKIETEIESGIEWSPDSWRKFPILQQPEYQDKNVERDVLKKLDKLPPLVYHQEVIIEQSC